MNDLIDTLGTFVSLVRGLNLNPFIDDFAGRQYDLLYQLIVHRIRMRYAILRPTPENLALKTGFQDSMGGVFLDSCNASINRYDDSIVSLYDIIRDHIGGLNPLDLILNDLTHNYLITYRDDSFRRYVEVLSLTKGLIGEEADPFLQELVLLADRWVELQPNDHPYEFIMDLIGQLSEAIEGNLDMVEYTGLRFPFPSWEVYPHQSTATILLDVRNFDTLLNDLVGINTIGIIDEGSSREQRGLVLSARRWIREAWRSSGVGIRLRNLSIVPHRRITSRRMVTLHVDFSDFYDSFVKWMVELAFDDRRIQGTLNLK